MSFKNLVYALYIALLLVIYQSAYAQILGI